MKVETMMTRNVRSCRPWDTLAAAAQIMWKHDCGAVPVVDDDGKLLGMLTDRDICMAVTMQNRAPGEIQVMHPMSRKAFSVRVSDAVEKAEAVMRSRRVRRVPVVDAEDRLVGILSVNDIVREAERERRKGGAREIDDARLRETLAAVCEPRVAQPA